MDTRQKIEEFSPHLWRTYREQQNMEPESWLHFLSFVFSDPKIDKISVSIDRIDEDFIPLGKIDDLVIFLNQNTTYKFQSLFRVCTDFLERLNFFKKKIIFVLVLYPSISGINLLFFSTQKSKSIERVKIILFPQGRIPDYYKEIIVSESERSPLELLIQLVDIPSLETDFHDQMERILQRFSTISKEYFIGYLTLLLIISGFTRFDNRFNWYTNKLHHSKVITFQDHILKILELSKQKNILNDDLMKIGVVLGDLGIDTLPIDQELFQTILRRFPFSLNEPTPFVQKVAITPLFLSAIVENSSYSVKKKKGGRFYTSSSNADFIAFLAIHRLLQNRLSGIEHDHLFNWVYQDWGFEVEPVTKTTIQTSSKSTPLKILDPACGSGAFFVSLARLVNRLALQNTNLGSTFFPIVEFFGVDPDGIAIIVTRLRLILLELQESLKQSVLNSTDRTVRSIRFRFDNIIKADFFSYEFLDKFDLILGNPPWVRHEDIGAGQEPEYKKWLMTRIRELSEEEGVFDGKSDFYIYFCILALSLLKKRGGVLAFLTSNAWLEVKYGQTLQKVLLNPNNGIEFFDIIHRTGIRLWHQLGINSIILIAGKSSSDNVTNTNGAFSESKVDFPQIPLSSLKKGIIPRKNHEDSYCRTELISKSQLKKTSKWAGIFLRMSSSEREIIRGLSTNGVPLSSLANIRFGIKTGANDFFHLKRINKEPRSDGKVYVENRGGYTGLIERKYLVPLVKSPINLKSFVIPSSFTPQLWLFYCFDSPEQLQGSEACTYIKWAENVTIKIKQGKKSGLNTQGYSSIRSVKQRDYWYSIGKYPMPDLLWTKSYHDKLGCFYNKGQVMPDQRFYGIIVEKEEYLPLIFTYLNSSFVWAQMEAQGNTNMGFGVLDTNVYWLKSLTIPLKALEEKTKIIKLMEGLIEEKKRVSMLQSSMIRSDIDQFYAQFFELSEISLQKIYDFISRSIKNRIQKQLHNN